MEYYEINERLARAAHDMMSMSEYRQGSATNEYRAAVDAAADLVERQKQRVSSYYHEKLDVLLDAYARRLAKWTDDHNRNGASCPSVMICGASKFPMRKKEKQIARENTLWKEYNEIRGLLDKIQSIGLGPVDLTDPQAREILTEQLSKVQGKLDFYKGINAHYKKHQTAFGYPGISFKDAETIDTTMADTNSLPHICGKPFPDYELSSVRDKIKRIQKRLEVLGLLEEQQRHPSESTKFDGGEIIQNAAENRLQILFDAIPDADTRQLLKSHGFHWSRKNQAWQRQLTQNAEHAARRIVGLA